MLTKRVPDSDAGAQITQATTGICEHSRDLCVQRQRALTERSPRSPQAGHDDLAQLPAAARSDSRTVVSRREAKLPVESRYRRRRDDLDSDDVGPDRSV
jgi:hypothetical protein